MRKLIRQFWHDDRGYVLATEWMLVASILTLGAIAGMLALRQCEETDPIDWPVALTR